MYMFIRLANVPIDCRASPKNLTETKAETVLLKFIAASAPAVIRKPLAEKY